MHSFASNRLDSPRPAHWILALGLALAMPAYAEFDFESGGGFQDDEFLKVDEAFILSVDLAPGREMVARWDMPDGYYLYRHQFKFPVRDNPALTTGEPQISPGKHKVDEFFGEVEVYYHNAEARIPLLNDAAGDLNAQVGITFQGCADAGLC